MADLESGSSMVDLGESGVRMAGLGEKRKQHGKSGSRMADLGESGGGMSGLGEIEGVA